MLDLYQPGTKLESEPKLARKLGVSVLTLRHALSLLAHEGLIERRHGSGTYVTDHQKRKAVALGAVTYPELQSSSFQVRLFFLLAELFKRKGYRCRSYIAPLGMQEGWSELAEDVERGRIAGAVFVSMNIESLPTSIPFAEKGVPCVGPGGAMPSVGLDYARLVRDGIRHLLGRGCRKIAVMQWTEDPLNPLQNQWSHDVLRFTMSELGVPVREEWIRSAVQPGLAGVGWEQFRDIWSARGEKPDGLLVTDDVLFRDAAMAILDSQIKVPDQLQVVVHANKGSGLTYPFPVSLLEVDLNKWAEAMMEQLIKLMNRETVSPQVHYVRARLIPSDVNADEHTSGITSSVAAQIESQTQSKSK